MRYIIEAALEQSQLLNRTLVLPSFVYARACEWEIVSCAAFAPMVNRGQAVHSTEWDGLPLNKQIAYRIPMQIMIDLPHLRKTHSVLLTSEYLKLNGLSPDLETSNGEFHRQVYLGNKKDEHGNDVQMTIRVVKNDEYDPDRVVRVDHLGPLSSKGNANLDVGPHSTKLWDKLRSKDDHTMISMNDARDAVRDILKNPEDDDELEKELNKIGWIVLHTWDGWAGAEWLKSVVRPIKQVAPLRTIRGWHEDYHFMEHDVIVLEGETHLGRKPGAMFFTTATGRDRFARTVLYALRPIEKIRNLGATLAERMRKKVGGHMWVAGHMRRGDFVREGWVMESSISDHLSRVQRHLKEGILILRKIHEEGKVTPFQIPDAVPNETQLTYEPPRDGEWFYIATDERDIVGLDYIRKNGGVLFGDLITIEDRQKFGWPMMITDVIALVEQVVLSHSYYFYAHAMSSVAGGAVNMRAAMGADSRTSWVD
ncbi:hypothetical protein FRC01_010563 [Tulasnella sp. 417]|nr:hypothetical protein FRC01_010563 [Tulasnella sp. 417]